MPKKELLFALSLAMDFGSTDSYSNASGVDPTSENIFPPLLAS